MKKQFLIIFILIFVNTFSIFYKDVKGHAYSLEDFTWDDNVLIFSRYSTNENYLKIIKYISGKIKATFSLIFITDLSKIKTTDYNLVNHNLETIKTKGNIILDWKGYAGKNFKIKYTNKNLEFFIIFFNTGIKKSNSIIIKNDDKYQKIISKQLKKLNL